MHFHKDNDVNEPTHYVHYEFHACVNFALNLQFFFIISALIMHYLCINSPLIMYNLCIITTSNLHALDSTIHTARIITILIWTGRAASQ
jgi:hypothetical protein